jgi:hypothetical protein
MWADYDSSLPVRSEADGLDERLHVKIVDGSSGAVNQATVDTDKNLHVEMHGNNTTGGTDLVLKLSELGFANEDGIYDASNNTDPSNVGLIGHVRSASPADSDQTIRWTGIQGSDANTVWAMDVSMCDGNGEPITTNHPLPIIQGSGANFYVDVDGVYSGSNTDPDNVGVVWHVRNATPGDAQQTFRPTGVQGTAVNTVWAIDVSMHDGSGNAYSSTNPLPISFGSGVSLNVDLDGVYNVSTNPDPDNVGLVISTRSAAPGDAEQTIKPTGVQGSDDNKIWAMDISLHDENGDAYTALNPLPIVITGATAGTSIHHWEKESAIAKDGTSEAAYQVAALKTLKLTKVFGAASGKMKMDISTGTSGSTVQTMVLYNSTAFPNVEYEFAETFTVAAGHWVRIVLTNLDNQAQDMYSMIEGEEV